MLLGVLSFVFLQPLKALRVSQEPFVPRVKTGANFHDYEKKRYKQQAARTRDNLKSRATASLMQASMSSAALDSHSTFGHTDSGFAGVLPDTSPTMPSSPMAEVGSAFGGSMDSFSGDRPQSTGNASQRSRGSRRGRSEALMSAGLRVGSR